MPKLVIKRDGTTEKFDDAKIKKALEKANANTIDEIIVYVLEKMEDCKVVPIEFIQDQIEDYLIKNQPNVYEHYHYYRTERTKTRELKGKLMQTVSKLSLSTDRDNCNVGNNFSAKLLRIASETNKYHNLSQMPKHLARLHESYSLYYHDLDSLNLTVNCLHIDLGEVLGRGFNPGYGTIKPPKRIETAAELACIILQSEQNDQFGGVSFNDFDNALAPYVAATRLEILEEYEVLSQVMSSTAFDVFIEEKLEKRVRQAMQGVCFNLNTLHSRAGSQVPFSSLNIGLPRTKEAALVCQLLLEEYNKGMGNGEQFIFPNIAFRVKKDVNRNSGDTYYYLFSLACEVAANRLNPTFLNMDSSCHIDYYNRGIIPAVMGCRTAICSNVNGEEGPAGRGNIFPTSINLPRLGIRSNKNIELFFELLQEKLNEVVIFTKYRFDILKQLKGKDIPFGIGQNLMKGSESIGPDDSIEPMLLQGTYGVGWIGLAETLIALTGKHHAESVEAQELGLRIVKFIHDFAKQKTEELKLNFSCYATPAEGLSGVFVKEDQKLFGMIPGITDKDFYTNSFAIPVDFKITNLEKLTLEAPYHSLCTGGHISYVEYDAKPTGAIVQKLITKAYDDTDIDYIGINFHKRYCKKCGLDIMPHANACECGSTEIQGVSRITGYLGLDERFGPGKLAEKRARISHAGKFDKNYYNI